MVEITVAQTQGLCIALEATYNANDKLPSVFDYHMGRLLPALRKEFNRIKNLDDETYNKIKDEKIDLPITKIHPSDLPENIPNNIQSNIGRVRAMELLQPILKDEGIPEHESQVEKLLQEDKEAEQNEEQEEAA